MARTFDIPAAESKYAQQVEYFRGVDMNESPGGVGEGRSPNAPNMIRDQVGHVRKRMGYETMAYDETGDVPTGAIRGAYTDGAKEDRTRFLADEHKIYTVQETADGLKLAEIHTERIGQTAAEITAFNAFSWGGKVYMLTGNNYLSYGEHAGSGTVWTGVINLTDETFDRREEKVPKIMISTTPAGAGTVYEAFNMLSSWFEQTFMADGTSTVYRLAKKQLNDDAAPVVKIMDSAGEWQTVTTGYTVDYAEGTVTFSTAPAVPTVTGQDNVSITACMGYREGQDNRRKLGGCTVVGLYGVGGKPDRVFLAGNPMYPGYEWYSGFDDPTYFPDTNYTQLTRDGGEIVGYSVINAQMATFLRGSLDRRNCVIRTGELDENGEALFRITNTLLGEAPVSTASFAAMGVEPLFLTEHGIYAVTDSDITGVKYNQQRSYYINKPLAEARGKAEACAVNFRNYYVLALDGDLYLLDGLQKDYERNAPYSSFQYECYYFPDIGAVSLWVDDDRLYFGTADGKVKRFFDDAKNPGSYNDDGAPIDAWWETADFDGKLFFRAKTYGYVAVRLAAAPMTGCKIYAQRRGIWAEVLDTKEKARYFDWSYIDFSKFVFSTDQTPRTIGGKVKLKKVDKVRFRIRNNVLNEPFGIYAFGFEWKEPGRNYKR